MSGITKKKIFVLIIGLAVLFLLLTWKGKTMSGGPKEENLQNPVQRWEEVIPMQRKFPRSAYPSFARDPFSLEVESVGGVTLNGVVWDEHSPKAIINDHIVGVGDTINGKTVLKIQQDKVTLKDGESQTELRMRFEHKGAS